MYRALQEEVETVLATALAARDLPVDDLGIEEPPDDVAAILASSVAFRLAGQLGDAPAAIAAQLADEIDVDGSTYVEAIVAEGPYLNVRASTAYYVETLTAAAHPDYGELEPTGERIVLEHTSANPTGPVHVGRARNPIIGDALARILDAAGHDVDRHYYVNDAGRQMAVFTWAYETFDEDDLDEPPDRDRVEYDLTRYYRKGNAFLEEADEAAVAAAEAEIEAILQGMEAGEEQAFDRVEVVVDQVLAGMRECLARLPAEFDEFVKETRFMRDGSTNEVVARLKAAAQAHTADGAWVLDLGDWGIEKEFVFLRSDGTTLYTTRDLAHHEWKFDHHDRAITVLGEDQELHARQLEAALEILGNDTDRLESLHYSWVNLPEGTMSTRAGTGVNLDDLLDESIARAREEVETRLDDRIRDDDLDADDIDRIARQVGIGAVRYDIVAKQRTKTITFEWDRALDFEAQSAPYLQYVHARCCGIMDEADGEPPARPDASVLEHPAERELLEAIARFPAVVEAAAAEREPHLVATYTRGLAEAFNAFYRDCPVTAAEVPADRREARLGLVAAARHTMANALNLLGVEAPESM